MRVRRDGWRRDGGRFMRSRVVVVVGVVLLEPSPFVDFAYDVPLDLVWMHVRFGAALHS